MRPSSQPASQLSLADMKQTGVSMFQMFGVSSSMRMSARKEQCTSQHKAEPSLYMELFLLGENVGGKRCCYIFNVPPEKMSRPNKAKNTLNCLST
jgi:hypothetical protein